MKKCNNLKILKKRFMLLFSKLKTETGKSKKCSVFSTGKYTHTSVYENF